MKIEHLIFNILYLHFCIFLHFMQNYRTLTKKISQINSFLSILRLGQHKKNDFSGMFVCVRCRRRPFSVRFYDNELSNVMSDRA